MVGSSVLSKLNTEHKVVGFDVVTHWEDWVKQIEAFRSNLPKLDLIVHCGAVVDPHVTTIDNESEVWEMNYLSTKHLGEYAKENGAKFLFFSSYAAKEPQTPYGWSKRVAEDTLKLILPENDLCIFRPMTIWSFDEQGKRGPSIVYKILSRQLNFVYKNCIRDCVHVSDVARAVHHITENWHNGTYEIGLGQPIEIELLAKQIYEKLPDFVRPEVIPSPLSYNYAVADKELLPPDWKPEYPSVLTLDRQMADHIREGVK